MDDLGCAGKHDAFGGLPRSSRCVIRSSTPLCSRTTPRCYVSSRNDTTTSSPIAPASSIAWTRCCVSWSLVASHRQLSAARAAAELRRIRPTDQIGIERCALRRVPLGRDDAAGCRHEEGPRPPTGPFRFAVRTDVGSAPGTRELRPGVVELAVDLVLQEHDGRDHSEPRSARRGGCTPPSKHHARPWRTSLPATYATRTGSWFSTRLSPRGRQLSPARRGNGVGRRALCIGLGPTGVDPDLRRLRRGSRTLPFSGE